MGMLVNGSDPLRHAGTRSPLAHSADNAASLNGQTPTGTVQDWHSGIFVFATVSFAVRWRDGGDRQRRSSYLLALVDETRASVVELPTRIAYQNCSR